MTRLKTKLTKKNEKGIALIFTLIMLSLLMILALSFTMDSMFEQKAAYNSASSSSAGFMTQAQLKQVLLLMKEGEANFDNGRLYSVDSTPGPTPAPVYHTDMLLESLPVAGLLKSDDKVFDLNNNGTYDDPKVNWNYIRDVNGDIIGRTAFVVVPEDKIPLDSLLDDSVNPNITQNEKNNMERRIGKDVSEINVRGAIPAVSDDISTITEALNWAEDKPETDAGFVNGKYTGSWSSFSDLFSTLNTVLSGDLTTAEKDEFEDKLSLDIFKDKEAFWAEASSGDRLIVDSELYKRFDLTRDWKDNASNADSLTFIKENILLDSDGDGVPDLDMEAWKDEDSDDTSKGLPWLACFGYKDNGSGVGAADETQKGTFALVKDRRYQIAANLKDYCDSDSIPTSDVNPVTSDTGTTWLTTSTGPAYTGNELTPYIDKLGVKIDVVQYSREDPGDSTKFAISLAADISIAVGLVNIYGTDWTKENLEMKIEGTIKFDTTIATGTSNVETTIPFSHTFNYSTFEWAGNYSRFIISSADSYPTGTEYIGEEAGFTSSNKKIDINDVEITFTKVVLYKDGGNDVGYDYLNNIKQNNANVIALNSGESVKEYWYGFAVHDPRQNLNSGDWKALTPASGSSPLLLFYLSGSDPYFGLSNSDTNGNDPTEPPSTGPDTETGTETELSTAYIRNAPMESPWELGFIHRGAKWETINLKTYDKSKAIQLVDISGKNYIPGGGAYASGDANILDQIKMTEKAETRQKINLNATDVSVFNALLYNVRCNKGIVGDMSIDSMSMAGNSFDAHSLFAATAARTTVVTASILDKYTTNPVADEILTRASVVDKLLLPGATGLTADNDAAHEELIGKIVNLTKVVNGVESFTIIVLAQTIKDIGSGGASITKYASDGTTSASKVCTLGTFDMTDNGSSKTNVYFDEITGEQKVMAKCRVVNGKVKIIKFQYCE